MISLRLYPILDENFIERHGLSPTGLLDLWKNEGIRFFQYRAKDLDSRERGRRLRSLLSESSSRGLRCIVNDDTGLFFAGLGDGFHLGDEDRKALSPADAIHIQEALQGKVHPLHFGTGILTGLSTHTPDQFNEALSLHAGGKFPLSCIAFGPCFPTESKTRGLHPRVSIDDIHSVLESLADARKGPIPVPDLVLIGGIHPDRIASILDGLAEFELSEPQHVFLASISAAADPGLLSRFRQLKGWER